MKKMLTLITIAMIAFVTNAQVVVAEKDWTGCTESDLIWYMFGDGQEGSVTADPDGIAITIPELSGQIWLPQTIILDGATLEDDHSFIVRITAKIPSDGQLQVNMGNWSDNYQEQVNVKAADDFQDIDIEFTNYPFMCDEDAHIILRSGFIVGKTIIKKVQIIDKDASGDPVVPVSILYKYNADNKTAEVIKTSQGKYKGDITIPATVTYEGEVYTVTKIGDNAFYNCTNLTSVSIPNSVTSIGISAFYYCKRLSSLNIPNSVTSIESSTFDRCSSLESITIPDGVTSIGNDAFRECRGLKSVSIPNRVTSIGSSAFSSCSGLTSVTIGNSVTSIGGWAFNGCSGLTSVTIPSSITSIGESAFQNCNDLKEIISEIAEPCQLNENVFPLHIYSIAKLSVPDGTKATYSATEGWNKFTKIVDGTEEIIIFSDAAVKALCIANWDTDGDSELSSSEAAAVTDLGTVFIDNKEITVFNELQYFTGISSIGDYAFAHCSGLTSVTIPNSVTSIGSDAFNLCSGLTSITIPNSVTIIGRDAFYGCSSLTSLSIPSGITIIDEEVFRGCSNLTFVEIPDNVTSIGFGAFSNCSNLTTITIPSNVTTIGGYAFWNCDHIRVIVSKIQNPCEIDGSYTFPPNVLANALLIVSRGMVATYQETEGWNKFSIIKDYDPRKLTINVATAGTLPTLIPADEKYLIEELALSGDLNGTDIHFIRDMAGINMDGMRYGDNEFWPGENSETKGQLRVLDMSDVNIVEGGRDYYRMLQSSVEGTFGDYKYTMTNTISDQMFSYCRKLEELILPRSVTSISATSIALEVNLKQFKVADGNPYYDSRNDCNAVIETASNKLILGSNNTIIPDGVTSIGSNAFSSCSSLSSITIPNSVTSIGYQSFYDCSSLTSITIPNSVTSIENKAFCWCNGLISVYIDIKEPLIIGMYTFTNRSNALLYVPKGCKAAYEAADYWKEFKEIKEFAKDEEVTCALEEDNTATVTAANDPTEKDVVIPESVIIGDESHPVTAIGENAFKNNTELALACIPETIDEIGDNAFAGCSNLKAIYCYNDEPIALGSDKATVRTRADGNETSATAVFADVDKTTCILYVPLNSANKYRTAEGWGEFENIVEMKSNILGDANNDGEVDDKDLEATSAYIMEGKTDSFIFKNADVKTDSRINAADIVKIVNLKK